MNSSIEIDFSFDQIKQPCLSECPDVTLDLLAAEATEHRGNPRLAGRIRRDVCERTVRCLGPVACGKQLECGLVHGNVMPTISLAFEQDAVDS